MKRLLLLALLSAAPGCAAMNLKNSLPWAEKDEPEFKTPHRLVAIWTDTVLHHAGKPSTRGFGGRLYFYDEHSNAIPVEGTLVVYAFDESKGEALIREPDRKFIFRPEDFVRHAEKTDLGQSYSVWLPWDALGGYRTQLTLLPMFTSKDGDVIAGQQSKHVLPGKEPTYYQPPGAVQQASYHALAPEPAALAGVPLDRQRQLRAVSIPITDTLKQRLINSQVEPPDGASLRTTMPRRMAEEGGGGAPAVSLRTAGRAVNGTGESRVYHTAGDAYQGETARIAAALQQAQATQQLAARGGANRDPQTLAQQSARFGRSRSPVPGGAVATPIPGPAQLPPFPAPPPFGHPSPPEASPQTLLPAAALNAGPPPR